MTTNYKEFQQLLEPLIPIWAVVSVLIILGFIVWYILIAINYWRDKHAMV